MIESFFIGPHGENSQFLEDLWAQLLERSLAHRRNTFGDDSAVPIDEPAEAQRKAVEDGIAGFFELLHREVPTFSNRYLGHMVSDVSIPALLGNAAVLFCNPNLASREVAEAGSQFETQAINELARMVGFDPGPARGHFTSGGTVANFEAFWRARYRLDHWLAMGAWLLENGYTNDDIFTLGHQGWEAFEANRHQFDIPLKELAQRSYVVRGPWDIADYYRDTLKMNFPQPVILVPGNKHYSWPKSANVFGISENAVWPSELDRHGRVSLPALRKNIERARSERRPIMLNVSVSGTTELGTVDPVDEVNELLAEYRERDGIHIWHHVDAAWGGYYCATLRGGRSELSDSAHRAFAAIAEVDSVTIDPHKLGYVPYACGAFLVRDPHSYSVSDISAPYLEEDEEADFPSWSTTLEGSRAATGAGAVWLSSRVLPLDASGHGELLNQGLRNKRRFQAKLAEHFDNIHFMPGGDGNIISFVLAPPGTGLAAVNRTTEHLVEQFAASPNFAISRTSLSYSNYRAMIDSVVPGWEGRIDDDYLLVVRMVIMSPYLGDTDCGDAIMAQFIEELRSLYGAREG